MADEPFSLDVLYGAIEQRIRDAIAGLAYVGTMPDMLECVALPAVVLELTELEPGEDQGTGEAALIARFEARVIVGSELEQCHQKAAFAASQLAVLLRMQTWGVAVGHAEFVRAAQDWTRPELDGYAVWAVEWTQPIWLGTEEWPWPDEFGGYLKFTDYPDEQEGAA